MTRRLATTALVALAAAGPLAALPRTPAAAPAFVASPTGVTERLRGISAVSRRVVWASGARGTIIRTQDGGATWTRLTIPDTSALDFRDIDATDERTAYALSIGPGDASRIYKTVDAGRTWALQFTNRDPRAFFDAMAFRDARTGFAYSDSVDGRAIAIRTDDGGRRWSEIVGLPPALNGEGAFAASGTNIALSGRHIWIGTNASRVLHSADDGRTWSAVATGMPSGESAGIFSIAFADARRGIVVGGDYKSETAADRNAAVTGDGGHSWEVAGGLHGFRSAVAFIAARRNAVIATGPSGSDYSTDGGRSWRALEGPGFHTLSVVPGTAIVWAAGESGRVGRTEF